MRNKEMDSADSPQPTNPVEELPPPRPAMGLDAKSNPVDVAGDFSSRDSRASCAVLALVGCALSAYLSAYQYGWLTHVWEPLFGNGSRIVLNSGLLDSLSHAIGFHLHDAALGAVGYGLEAGLALAGKRNRASPGTWLYLAYCAVVLLLGITSLVLVVLQAAVFHAWCTLCLVSALISEVIVVLSRRELAASAGFLIRKWSGKHA